jgi:hypothetical protein
MLRGSIILLLFFLFYSPKNESFLRTFSVCGFNMNVENCFVKGLSSQRHEHVFGLEHSNNEVIKTVSKQKFIFDNLLCFSFSGGHEKRLSFSSDCNNALKTINAHSFKHTENLLLMFRTRACL